MISEAAKEKIWNRIRKTNALLGALVFAFLTWMFVALNHKYVAAWKVPVLVKMEKSERAVSNDFDRSVEVKFEGEGWKLISFYIRRPEWVLNLSEELPKDSLIISTLKYYQQYIKPIPEGVVALEVLPTVLQFKFTQKLSKSIPITLGASLRPKAGFAIPATLRFEPESLTVTGPKDLIQSLQFWETENKEFDNLEGRFQIPIGLKNDFEGKVIKSVSEVVVKGEAQFLTQVEFPNLEIKVNNIPVGVNVTIIPNKLDITVSGAVSDLYLIRPESLQVSVDYESILKDTTGVLTPELKLPNTISLLKISQSEVRYILRR
ncbi:MAG: hypothetical protein SFU91_09810 [Chloroherpetonaceae bacterium]|nr:hypothetical protein [Chloroherpetonaceae bacterium]